MSDANAQYTINDPWNSFGFGLESVSYERSRRAKHAQMQHFSARVFFVKIVKSKDSMIYAILRFFRIQFLKNVLVQICPGPAPWARPMGRAHIGPWPDPKWAWPGPYLGLGRPKYGPGIYRYDFLDIRKYKNNYFFIYFQSMGTCPKEKSKYLHGIKWIKSILAHKISIFWPKYEK